MNFDSPTLDATRDRLLARFGADVDTWWQALPTTIDQLVQRWELTAGDAVGRGNTSLVVRCQRADGRAAMLKLTPETDLAAAEAAALRSWQPSSRVPAVWGHDKARGALLLEALPNETPLAELGTPVEVNDIAGLIVELHRTGAPVIGNGIVPQAERIDFIFEHWIGRHASRGPAVTRAVPIDRLHRGHALARELVTDPAEPVLLHGDLHPGNVLDGGAERGLVAIDPRPCVGDAAVDLVDWVFWPTSNPRAWEPRSRDLALAVGVSHERLWTWCAAFAAMLASSEAAHGNSAEKIDALLNLAP